jgi:hypothetical protein
MTVGLVLIALLMAGCGKSSDAIKKEKAAQISREREARFESLASRYGAITPWSKGVGVDALTYEYQTALMRSQSQPIAFEEATLEDVIIESGQVVGHFWVMDKIGDGPPMLYLHLRLDGAEIQSIRGMAKNIDSCSIVAKDLNPRAETDKDGVVEIVAEGACVALEKQ